MSLTAEEREAILNAQKMAIEALNAKDEFFYPIQQNLDIVRDELIKQGVPVTQWFNLSIWISAIVGCKADSKLIERPTREQRNAELHSKDRYDGSRTALGEAKRKQSQKSGKEEYEAAQAWARESLSQLMEPKAAQKKKQEEQETAAAAFAAEQRAIIDSLPVETHFTNFTKEQKRQFMRLIPDSIRLFNRRQHEYQRTHPVETE